MVRLLLQASRWSIENVLSLGFAQVHEHHDELIPAIGSIVSVQVHLTPLHYRQQSKNIEFRKN